MGNETVIPALIEARDSLRKAKDMKCRCTGFILQYEGGCQCERGKQIKIEKAKIDLLLSFLQEDEKK
jgi:hypothetical protein